MIALLCYWYYCPCKQKGHNPERPCTEIMAQDSNMFEVLSSRPGQIEIHC